MSRCRVTYRPLSFHREVQSVQTIASFLYYFSYIPYSVFKKEVLSLPAKVSNKIKDDGKQKAWLCLRHNRASFFCCILYKSCVQNECLFQMLAPSKSSLYLATASEISLILINSSAEWEREDSPGPSLNEGKCIRAWSLRVGLPNGFMPMATHFLIRGCAGSMRDDFRRKLWAFTSLFRCWQINL